MIQSQTHSYSPLPEYVYYDISALNFVEPDIFVSVRCDYDLRQIIRGLDVLFENEKDVPFLHGLLHRRMGSPVTRGSRPF